MKDELVPFVCPQCGRHLADAPRGASVSCPACKVWVTTPVKRKGKVVSRDSRASRRTPDHH